MTIARHGTRRWPLWPTAPSRHRRDPWQYVDSTSACSSDPGTIQLSGPIKQDRTGVQDRARCACDVLKHRRSCGHGEHAEPPTRLILADRFRDTIGPALAAVPGLVPVVEEPTRRQGDGYDTGGPRTAGRHRRRNRRPGRRPAHHLDRADAGRQEGTLPGFLHRDRAANTLAQCR
jgi:hypothetical protein